MSTIRGKTVLITGGASGIGRLMGEQVLREGARLLIILDLNRETLLQTKTDFEQSGFKVEVFQIDVSETERLLGLNREISQRHGVIDILINNAGIVVGKKFADHSHQDIDRTMQINATALMHLTKIVLPGMIAQGSGHIVNIASAAGLVSNPNMSVYCASKWAVIGWSDSLRLELRRNKTGVNVTTVTPYYIDTGMFKGVKSPILPILKPLPMAQAIIRAIKRDAIFLRRPRLLYVLPFVKGLLPTRVFDIVVGQWLGVYTSMDEFTGRGA